MCVCVTTINEKRGCGFEREKGGWCGRVWREESEWRKKAMIISKKKQFKKKIVKSYRHTNS